MNTSIATGLAFFVSLAIVGTLESARPVTKQERVQACVIDTGATTDLEIITALQYCARRYEYKLTPADLP